MAHCIVKWVRVSAAAALAALALAPAWADVISADAARRALARGAVAWDVRESHDFAAGHLPGAVQADAALLAAWQREGGLEAIEAAVSAAGIDLSREVLVYGHAGDPKAQSLYATLERVAPGRVHWFVGGVAEWAQSGAALAREAAVARRPVPQRLVVLRGEPGSEAPVRMASEALRRAPAWTPSPLAWLEARVD